MTKRKREAKSAGDIPETLPVGRSKKEEPEASGGELSEVRAGIAESVRNVESADLKNDVLHFLEKLQAAVPEKKRGIIEKLKNNLLEIAAHIGEGAQELKKNDIRLPEAQQRILTDALELLPAGALQEAQKYWTLQSQMLAELLRELDEKGCEAIANLKGSKFHLRKKFIREVLGLFKSMNEGDSKISALRQNFGTDRKEKYDEQKSAIRLKYHHQHLYQDFNTEDIADAEIIGQLYQEIMDSLHGGVSAKNLAQKIAFAVSMNFTHLRNSIASQKIYFYECLLQDMEDGLEKNPHYYDQENPDHLYKSESEAFAQQFFVLYRSLEGILESQRLAKLLSRNHE